MTVRRSKAKYLFLNERNSNGTVTLHGEEVKKVEDCGESSHVVLETPIERQESELEFAGLKMLRWMNPSEKLIMLDVLEINAGTSESDLWSSKEIGLIIVRKLKMDKKKT